MFSSNFFRLASVLATCALVVVMGKLQGSSKQGTTAKMIPLSMMPCDETEGIPCPTYDDDYWPGGCHEFKLKNEEDLQINLPEKEIIDRMCTMMDMKEMQWLPDSNPMAYIQLSMSEIDGTISKCGKMVTLTCQPKMNPMFTLRGSKIRLAHGSEVHPSVYVPGDCSSEVDALIYAVKSECQLMESTVLVYSCPTPLTVCQEIFGA